MNKRIFIIISLLVCLVSLGQAQSLKPAPIFSSHMILQRDMSVPVYGTAAPFSRISVSFAGKKVKGKADSEGKWKVWLPAMNASFEGRTMEISSGKETVTLSDVVIGEVWVAAGQSNMQYTMKLYRTYQKPYKGKDIQALELQKPENPKIRVFQCERNDVNESHWAVAGPKSLEMVSSPGYFCVKNLQDSLGVPVGVISNAIGGTKVETWHNKGEWYEKMVAPYVPFAIRGFLWFQGENNCSSRESNYVSKFRLMTQQWREAFGNAEAPFCCVMLAPHIYSSRKHKGGYIDAEELPRFRMQQMECIDSIPGTELIFTPDLVDDLTDIHFSYKWEVGRRLAVLALNKVYGRSELEWSGPRALSATPDGKGGIDVTFSHADGGLVAPKSKCVRWFEVAGPDGIWHSALAMVTSDNTVHVTSYHVSNPVSVRYLWHETAVSTDLKNKSGHCAFPFSTTTNQPIE